MAHNPVDPFNPQSGSDPQSSDSTQDVPLSGQNAHDPQAQNPHLAPGQPAPVFPPGQPGSPQATDSPHLGAWPPPDGAAPAQLSFLPPKKKGHGKSKLLLVVGLIVVVVLAAGGGGYWLWSSGTFASMLASSDDSGKVTSEESKDSQQSGGEEDDESSPEESPSQEPSPSQEESSAESSVSAPTAVVAWSMSGGKYRVKWAEPTGDADAKITGYVVSECDGGELKEVDGDTLFVTVKAEGLDCVSVHAVTESGPGDAATAEVKNN